MKTKEEKHVLGNTTKMYSPLQLKKVQKPSFILSRNDAMTGFDSHDQLQRLDVLQFFFEAKSPKFDLPFVEFFSFLVLRDVLT